MSTTVGSWHCEYQAVGDVGLGNILHHERQVVPQVVLVADVMLEADGVLAVEGVAVDAADETDVVDVVLVRVRVRVGLGLGLG